MPGATSTSDDVIEQSLKKSLNISKSRDLDQNIASSAQRLLQQTIEFVPAVKPHSVHFSSLKSKYILLKPSKRDEESKPSSSSLPSPGIERPAVARANGPGAESDLKMGESLPSPRVIIYPPEQVKLRWQQRHKVGGGLVNLGNTCFMNATLQCLTYTAPLANYCMSQEHARTCKQQQFCLMCALRQHIKTAFHNSGSAFKPVSILHKMRYIAKHFRHGRQEDAHEFLRLFIDCLQKSCLDGHKKLDKISRETTIIHQIFGGFLRSQVQCLKCGARSNTYEPFMDLSLNLKDVNTVEAALGKYVKPETLDAANAYDCQKCRKKTPARKRFSLHKIPNVLTIQLNRFGFTRAAGKINKHIQFPEKLNIRQYMSRKQGDPEYYHLYGVLIHSGHHCNMGHYYCYVRSPANSWYTMNDSSVHPVSASRVFGSQAYLLFYSKAVPSLQQSASKVPLIAPTPNGPVTPKFNATFSKQADVNASYKTKGDVGVPVSRQMVSPTKTPQSPFVFCTSPKDSSLSSLKNRQASPMTSTTSPLQPVQSNLSAKVNKSPKSTSSGQGIVMQIKNGKVVTTEKGLEGTPKSVTTPLKRKHSLVEHDDAEEGGAVKEPRKESKFSDSKVPTKHKDKENSVKEKKTTKFSKLFSDFQERQTVDKHHDPKHQKMDSGELDKSTPKLRKESTFQLKDETSPDAKKEKSSGMNKVSVHVPCFTRVNSSPSVHNVWHVRAVDPTPSPSMASVSSNNSTPSILSANGEWSMSAGSKLAKKHHSLNASWTLTMDQKKKLFARSESFDQAKAMRQLSPLKRQSHQSETVQNNGDQSNPFERLQREHEEVLKLNNSESTKSSPVSATPSKIGSESSMKKDPKILEENSNLNGFNYASPQLESLDGSQISHKKHKKKKKKKLHKQLGNKHSELEIDSAHKKTTHDNEQVVQKGKKHKHKTSDDKNSNDRNKDKANLKRKREMGHASEEGHASFTKIAKRDKNKEKTQDRGDSDYLNTPSQIECNGGIRKAHKKLFNTSQNESDDGMKTAHKKHKTKKKLLLHFNGDHSDTEKASDSVDKNSSCENGLLAVKHKKKKHRESAASENHANFDQEINSQKTQLGLTSTNGDCFEKISTTDDFSCMKMDPRKGTPHSEDKKEKSSERPVPVQAWDHYVKDSLGKKKQDDSAGGKPTLLWDGTRKSHVVEELWKRPTVSTWGGERSEADIEAEREEKRRKKKTWRDHYEEEMDRGKVKKQKKKVDDTPLAFNPFQKYQNHRNQEKIRWDEDASMYGHKRHSFGSSDSVPLLSRSHSDSQSYNHFPSSKNQFQQDNHDSGSGFHSLVSRSNSVY